MKLVCKNNINAYKHSYYFLTVGKSYVCSREVHGIIPIIYIDDDEGNMLKFYDDTECGVDEMHKMLSKLYHVADIRNESLITYLFYTEQEYRELQLEKINI